MTTSTKKTTKRKDGRAGRRNGQWKPCCWPGCNQRAVRRHLCNRDYKRAVVVDGKLPEDWPSQSVAPPTEGQIRSVFEAWDARHAAPEKQAAPVLTLHRGENKPSEPATPAAAPKKAQTKLEWLARQLDEARRARQMAQEAETWTSVAGLMREERALRGELDAERERLAAVAEAAGEGTLSDLPRDQYLAKLAEHAETLDVEALEVYVQGWLGKTGHALGNEGGQMVIRRATA